MTITLTRTAGVARITLNRPEKLNAINGELAVALRDAALEVEKDASVKVVVLTGAGSAFSVGGDLSEFLAHRSTIRSHIAQMAGDFHQAILAFKRMSAPLIVGVNGTAAGGGFSLALQGDLTVAKRSAKFVSAYTKSGLTPDGGGTWVLPRLVGRQRAFEIMASNRAVGAEEALSMGLIARLIDDAEFDSVLDGLAIAIADLPSGAAQSLKKLFTRDELQSLEAQLSAETESIAVAASRPETLARLEAFLRK